MTSLNAHPLTRRRFIEAGSMALAAATFAKRLSAMRAGDAHQPLTLDDPVLKQIADAALNAATSAGAQYADVRIMHTRYEDWGTFYGMPGFPKELGFYEPSRYAKIGVGVRALVNGYWGVAGLDGVITPDVAAKAGRDAARQAAMAATGKPRIVELAPAPVATGSWVMPVEVDPFTVSLEEKADFVDALIDNVRSLQYGVGIDATLYFIKQERTFASSEGAYTTQTVYNTNAQCYLWVPNDWMTELAGVRSLDCFWGAGAGAGWEHIRDMPVREQIVHAIDQAMSMRRPKPIDVGRYDVVFDARSMANLLGTSIGVATELDRAMGYRANDEGTSYLSDPLGMLGTYKIGSPLVTVTANRSMPGGCATVRWDDEGVAPRETTLVQDGILTDFQTTREGASWLAPFYRKRGKTVASNGCAGVYGPTDPLQQVSPNLVMQPGRDDTSFDELVRSTEKGLAIVGTWGSPDQQVLNGAGRSEIVYEIHKGKITGTFKDVVFLYRAPEFWRNVVAIGGARSAQRFGFNRWRKNEENDRTMQTIAAVPAKVKNVAVVDQMRKA